MKSIACRTMLIEIAMICCRSSARERKRKEWRLYLLGYFRESISVVFIYIEIRPCRWYYICIEAKADEFEENGNFSKNRHEINSNRFHGVVVITSAIKQRDSGSIPDGAIFETNVRIILNPVTVIGCQRLDGYVEDKIFAIIEATIWSHTSYIYKISFKLNKIIKFLNIEIFFYIGPLHEELYGQFLAVVFVANRELTQKRLKNLAKMPKITLNWNLLICGTYAETWIYTVHFKYQKILRA